MLVNEGCGGQRLGIANDEDIELAMQKGVNYPKGLLNWGKEIGYKTISETLQNLYNEYRRNATDKARYSIKYNNVLM